MRFFPREKGKTAFSKKNPRERPFSSSIMEDPKVQTDPNKPKVEEHKKVVRYTIQETIDEEKGSRRSARLQEQRGESKRALRDINLSRRALWVGFEERNLGRPGNFPGPLAVFKKFVQKKFVCIFRSLLGRGVCETKNLRNPPAWHRGLPGPSGPERQTSPKRVRKGESPKSALRSPKRVQKRSFGLFLGSFRTPERTLWGLWGSPGPEAPGRTLSDSFRTLLGFRA